MPFITPVSDESRQRQERRMSEAAGAAMLGVRERMATGISRSSGIYRPGNIYQDEWWLGAVGTLVAPALARTIEEFGIEAARRLRLSPTTLRTARWQFEKSLLLDEQLAAINSYTDTANLRVVELTERANDEGWDDDTLAGHLGLAEPGQEGASTGEIVLMTGGTVLASDFGAGPMSPGMARSLAETETHTAAEGAGHGVGAASGKIGTKRWDTSFVNSRQTHLDANGQEVRVEDFFVVGGEFAEYPGDWALSAGNRINCQCSAAHNYREAGTDWAEEPTTLTETQLANRRETVENAVNRGTTTDKLHDRLGPDGKGWSVERSRLHREIVDDLWAQAQSVPNEGQAIFSGGMGGAGKGTTLRSPAAGIDQSRFLELNADVMKEALAARGAIPVPAGLSPLEGAALVHSESSYLADLLAQRAYAARKNIIWDTTMKSASKTGGQIDALLAAGYDAPTFVFVDIPVETSVTRALARHQRGLEEWLAGEGLGGRYVPPDVIRSLRGTTYESVNREAFEELKDRAGRWMLFDNSGAEPRLLASWP